MLSKPNWHDRLCRENCTLFSPHYFVRSMHSFIWSFIRAIVQKKIIVDLIICVLYIAVEEKTGRLHMSFCRSVFTPSCLSIIKGEKKFMLGDEPNEVDCAVFGQLSQVKWHVPDTVKAKSLLEGRTYISIYNSPIK